MVVIALFLVLSCCFNSRKSQSLKEAVKWFQTEGQWSSWGEWSCDAICGSGMHFRRRQCIAAGDFGVPTCEGNGFEKTKTACEVECPGIKQIKDWLIGPKLTESEQKSRSDLLVAKGGDHTRKAEESVQLSCSDELIGQLMEKYPKSALYWEKNGAKLFYNISRMQLSQKGVLMIDAGSMVNAVADENLPVTCNSDVIGKIFPGLEVEWVVNNTGHVLKDYGVQPADEINRDVIENVQRSYSGLWVCVVRDGVRNRSWTTNAFYVNVMPRNAYWCWRRLSTVFGNSKFVVIAACCVTFKMIVLMIAGCIERGRKKKLLAELDALIEISDRISASKEPGGVQRTHEPRRPGNFKRAVDRVMDDVILQKGGTPKRQEREISPRLATLVDPIMKEIGEKSDKRRPGVHVLKKPIEEDRKSTEHVPKRWRENQNGGLYTTTEPRPQKVILPEDLKRDVFPNAKRVKKIASFLKKIGVSKGRQADRAQAEFQMAEIKDGRRSERDDSDEVIFDAEHRKSRKYSDNIQLIPGRESRNFEAVKSVSTANKQRREGLRNDS